MIQASNGFDEIGTFTYYRGRVGLTAVLRALGIGRGDDVAIQAFTCLAVPEGVMASGARPVYVDTEPESVTMDPADLAAKVTPKTRAVVVQHTFGIPADMSPIVALAEQRGLPVIEDCCHTLLSSYGGRRAGTFGCATFYSFEWGKPLVAGIGGSAVVNDPKLAGELARLYSEYSEPRGGWKLQLQYVAFSILYRPSLYWRIKDVFHALSKLGVAKGTYNAVSADYQPAEDFRLRMIGCNRRRMLRSLDQIQEHAEQARRVAAFYDAQVCVPWAQRPRVPQCADVVYGRYPLFVQEKPRVLAAARKAGVELAEWYSTPAHPLTQKEWPLVHYSAGSCPHAETATARIVSLPTHHKTGKRFLDKAARFFAGLRF